MWPTVYALPCNIQDLNTLERVAAQLGCLLLPFESTRELRDNFSSTDNSVIVLATNASYSEFLPTLREVVENVDSKEILLLTTDWTASDVVRAIREGVTDVLDRPADDPSLLRLIDEALARDSLRRTSPKLSIPLAIKEKLTFQESKILSCIIAGRTTKQIGAELDLSVRTIHYRIKSILSKLGVSSRSEAIELLRRALGLSDFNLANVGARKQIC
ncbi:MAG: LuxR C-terminal-related transcriptional regulator [Pirellula sp.]|jgi:DNA-binding NarL/FixJ family response regulator|nr:LuxR C-terminal-related transcriptional regulator [Pirellula sp.]